MTNEEQVVYEKIVSMKRSNELLTVIFEEIDELINSGYNGSFNGEALRGMLYAVNEYKKWKTNENQTR